MKNEFFDRLTDLESEDKRLLMQPNEKRGHGNGVYHRYKNPILTAAHTPLFWRYDLNTQTNPYLVERFGVNAVMNAGAIKWNN